VHSAVPRLKREVVMQCNVIYAGDFLACGVQMGFLEEPVLRPLRISLRS
jgi:hypothetical protein